MTNNILRAKGVMAKTGLSRACIYSYIGKGMFPKQISLGGKSVGWLESDIDEWIEQCAKKSRENELKKNNPDGKQKRRKYSAEFKDQALARAEKDGIAQVARELGVAESMLYSWRTKQRQFFTTLEN